MAETPRERLERNRKRIETFVARMAAQGIPVDPASLAQMVKTEPMETRPRGTRARGEED